MIRSNEINPLREAISKETTIFWPDAFWSKIREISQESNIKSIQKETMPSKISESDLTANLYRFGYTEFGSTLTDTANKYCIEYLITSLILTNEARRLEAIPIILAKNDFNENVLAFLSQKYRTAGKLLGLLRALQKFDKIENAISILETFSEEEIPSNEKSIQRNMELYNAI